MVKLPFFLGVIKEGSSYKKNIYYEGFRFRVFQFFIMRNLIFTCDIFRIENADPNILINPQAKNLDSIYGLCHSFINEAYKPDVIKRFKHFY